MFCLQSHYRKPLTFSYDNLDNTATAYNKLVKRISALSRDGEPDMAKAEELTKDLERRLTMTSTLLLLSPAFMMFSRLTQTMQQSFM